MKLRRRANLLKILSAQNKCSSDLLDNFKFYFSMSNCSFPLVKKKYWDAASSLWRKCYLEETLLNYASAFIQWKLSTFSITFLNWLPNVPLRFLRVKASNILTQTELCLIWPSESLLFDSNLYNYISLSKNSFIERISNHFPKLTTQLKCTEYYNIFEFQA